MKNKKQILWVLPLLVIPSLTLGFWALGGGKGSHTGQGQTQSALNTELPAAHLPEKPEDKMSFYQQAELDSEKQAMAAKADPYFGSKQSPEKKVFEKLDQLDAVLQQRPPAPAAAPLPAPIALERAQAPAVAATAAADTSELGQLNGMLNKILEIQHPECNSAVNAVARQQALPINPDTGAQAGFYTTGDNPGIISNAIEAVVHADQTLVSGSIIKLRLLQAVSFGSHRLNKDAFVYGTVTLNKERLEIELRSIRDDHAIVPVRLQVYDMDGLEGIYIPGAIGREVAKQSADNALQGLALSSLDPSIGAQAASAGIESAKSLLSKKVRQIKVQVKAGYRILLKDIAN